jgi:hypothetical protein
MRTRKRQVHYGEIDQDEAELGKKKDQGVIHGSRGMESSHGRELHMVLVQGRAIGGGGAAHLWPC